MDAPQDPRRSPVEEVTRLLDDFFGPVDVPGAIEWRAALEGEELSLDICRWGAPDAKIETITYVADGVKQLAPPRAFDPLRCASALNQALDAGGDRLHVDCTRF